MFSVVMRATEILIDEAAIPVRDEVLGVCEILGLDPLYIANEGKVVVFCAKGDADVVLQAMRAHARGSQAALIGRVEAAGRPRVVLTTPIGTQREIDLPTGELVPRIC